MADDILILGAGAAGLMAWRELRAAGIDATILEGRDRIGGRIWTERVPGVTRPIELGAEFVHGKPKITREILRRAKIKRIEGVDTRLLRRGKTLQPFQEFWQIIEKADRGLKLGMDFSYAKYLSSVKATPFEKRIAKMFVEGFNAARATRISASAVALEDRASAEIEGERIFRVPAGYDAIPGWLAEPLTSDSIHLQTQVREIRWRKGHVEVRTQSPAGERSYISAGVIVTLPLGVLSLPAGQPGAVRFEPPIGQKLSAMRRLEMGHVTKVVFRFTESFWKKNGRFGFAMAPGAAIPTWWTYEPENTNFLTGWSGGPGAEKLIALSGEQLLDEAVKSLSTVFNIPGRELKPLVAGFHYHNWGHDPFSRGAYSYQKAKGIAAARVLAAPVEATVFFAGEATDFEGASGTVHAALESGRRAARELIAAHNANEKRTI